MDAEQEEVTGIQASVRVLKDEEVKRCVVSRGKQGWEFRVEKRGHGTFASAGWPTAAAATGVLGLFLRTGWAPRGGK